ncbi:hypothetical protein Scep_025897 [Stephania cephalantha]|uniref:Tf2-1-like SH3-like domain-containing protein n=1 Tax=Stephania cephalantha TaxID=152367 RepID=A0AAP0EPP6_9MAGN
MPKIFGQDLTLGNVKPRSVTINFSPKVEEDVGFAPESFNMQGVVYGHGNAMVERSYGGVFSNGGHSDVEVLEKINPNAYRLKLSSHFRTGDVFNVKHLVPYYGDTSDDDNSRANSVHPGENDEVQKLACKFLEKYDGKI